MEPMAVDTLQRDAPSSTPSYVRTAQNSKCASINNAQNITYMAPIEVCRVTPLLNQLEERILNH